MLRQSSNLEETEVQRVPSNFIKNQRLALPQMVSVVRLARVKAVGRHAQGKKERQNGNGCNSSKVVHNKSLKAAHCVRWTASVSAFASQIVCAAFRCPLAQRYMRHEKICI